MSLLSLTVGRFIPKYKTLDEWLVVYRQLIRDKAIVDSTKANRMAYLNHLSKGLGSLSIGSIRPHHIATLAQSFVAAGRNHLAHRLLIEARCCFNEALNYGWIDTNPALELRNIKAPVTRQRLTMDEWHLIYDYVLENSPPWVALMMILALVTGQRRGDLRNMRFDHVWDGFLHIEQEKTGAMLALPLKLKLATLDMTLKQVLIRCRMDDVEGWPTSPFLLRKHNGSQLSPASMSWRFEQAREAVLPEPPVGSTPASLHELRSLSARAYEEQGLGDIQTLMGHARSSMTDLYLKGRNIKAAPDYKVLQL